MCGIVGVLSSDLVPSAGALESSLALLKHRGPDGEGVWTRPPGGPLHVSLGHRRLAIIDLSDAAAQPMSNDDGTLWITYNGEVYNYVELMAELEAKGHRFRSRSDTEVILKAYEEWGVDCLSRLNGMFAFAIWDERRRELFAARDRFGEKPFHYAWDSRRGFFAFASEIKALLAMPEVDRGIDDRALYRFVAFQELAASEQTLWRGVRRLPHAHWLRLSYRAGGLNLVIRRYWDIDLERTERMSLKEAARRFAEIFADSVRLRLRSDVPVGTSLSGGLDSSAVVCQIHALGAAGGQKTFSARMEDPALDEGEHIATVLAKTGVEGHRVWPSAEELREGFSKLCYHLEEPFISTSQFAQHLVMRLAGTQDVTVLLDGQGADEIVAGYEPYFLARYSDLAGARNWLKLWRERRAFRCKHPRPFPLNARAAAAKGFPGAYGFLKGRPSLPPPPTGEYHRGMTSWWDEGWLREFGDERPQATPASGRDGLTLKLYADAMQGELQELLRYGDRNSMAWSREVRQPFLDHRLAELSFALPPEYKLANGETKVVLREAFKGLIPESIRRRQDKLGYQAPLPSWLGGTLRHWAEGRLEQLSGDFKGRVIAGAGAKLRATPHPMTESSARLIFSMITLAESSTQLLKTTRATVGAS